MVEPGNFSFKDSEEAVLLADLYLAVTKTKGGWEYMKGYMGEGSGLGISIIKDQIVGNMQMFDESMKYYHDKPWISFKGMMLTMHEIALVGWDEYVERVACPWCRWKNVYENAPPLANATPLEIAK